MKEVETMYADNHLIKKWTKLEQWIDYSKFYYHNMKTPFLQMVQILSCTYDLKLEEF